MKLYSVNGILKFKFFDDVVNQEHYILIFFSLQLNLLLDVCHAQYFFTYASQKSLSIEESIQPAS